MHSFFSFLFHATTWPFFFLLFGEGRVSNCCTCTRPICGERVCEREREREREGERERGRARPDSTAARAKRVRTKKMIRRWVIIGVSIASIGVSGSVAPRLLGSTPGNCAGVFIVWWVSNISQQERKNTQTNTTNKTKACVVFFSSC